MGDLNHREMAGMLRLALFLGACLFLHEANAMLPRGAFKCTPFGDQNAEPWIIKEIHNQGKANEHFVYRANGISEQDDKKYPTGSFVDSATIQKYIRDLSQSQKSTQGFTITNTALGAAIQIPMMMEMPEGQEKQETLLDDDSPDCWIGTSFGTRKVSLRMDKIEKSGVKRPDDVSLNMFFVKMTVCKRTEALPGTRIVKDVPSTVRQLGEGEGVAEGSSGGALLELQEGGEGDQPTGKPTDKPPVGGSGGSAESAPVIDTPLAGAVMMEGGKAFITKCDVKQTLIAAYGCPDEHAMKQNAPKPTGKPTDKPAAQSGLSKDQQKVASSGVGGNPTGRRLLQDKASASSKISAGQKPKSTAPKQVIVEKGMCSTVVNKYLAMFM